MENLLQRIAKIVDNEGITITSLESKIGASKGVLSRALANDTDIQSKWLIKIVENYPHYNPEWLLTGKQPMLKKDLPNGNELELNLKIIELQNKYIQMLEGKIVECEKMQRYLLALEKKLADADKK